MEKIILIMKDGWYLFSSVNFQENISNCTTMLQKVTKTATK